MAVVAREHESGGCDLQIGLFNFIDTVYRQALFVTFACYEHGVGQQDQWISLPEQQFLAYFRMNAPEEGKEFLREKFCEEPYVSDQYTMRQFAAMMHHFRVMFGLGDAPEWTEQASLKSAKLMDIKPLVDRLIRQIMVIPEDRATYIRGLEAADFAKNSGATVLLEQQDYKAVGTLIREGMIRASQRQRTVCQTDRHFVP